MCPWTDVTTWERRHHHAHLHNNYKVNKKKHIPMIALWCPAFTNHGWLSHGWSYYSYYFDYLLSLFFKGSFRTLSSSFYVSYTSSFLPVSELECAFYYAPCWLIDCASWNNATSLTTYIMHSCICDTNKYNIYIYIQPRGKES